MAKVQVLKCIFEMASSKTEGGRHRRVAGRTVLVRHHCHTLLAGNQFFFPDGGVSAFDVLAIEASAGLDPNNPIGFLTGLTFVTDGSFTGTMTPISIDVAAVPEPETYAMLLAGLGVLGFAARRRTQQSV